MRAFVATSAAVLLAIILGVGGLSVLGASTSPAAAQREQAARALEHDEVSSFSSVNSPLFEASGIVTDVVAVKPTPSSLPQLNVLAWLNNSWRLLQTIHLPARDRLVMRASHIAPGRTAAPVWFTRFDLGPAQPGVALYDMGASGWDGLVIAELAGHWGIVPFPRYGRRVLPYPYFVSASIVTTATDSCKPNCAAGRWVSRSFRFNAASGSFQTSRAPYAGPPRVPSAP